MSREQEIESFSEQEPMKLREWSNLLATRFIPKSLKYIDFHQVPSMQQTCHEFIYLVSPLPRLY